MQDDYYGQFCQAEMCRMTIMDHSVRLKCAGWPLILSLHFSGKGGHVKNIPSTITMQLEGVHFH